MKQKVLIFATSFLDELLTHPEGEGRAMEMLKNLEKDHNIIVEYRCNRNPSKPLEEQELDSVIAVIADLEKYRRELLSKVGVKAGGELRLISRYGIGVDSVDLNAATEYGVLVTNTPGANALPTAEWAVTTMLDVAGRRIHQHEVASRGRTKRGPSRVDISGKTLGVVGTGNIGKNVVKLLKGFEMKVIASDLYPDERWAEENNVSYTDLESLCREADFITLHASAGKTIIGEAEIALMKPMVVLVNCARGILVDNRSVYKAVKDGKIWGYGIDEVWEYADLPTNGLNIVTSPHVGSDTDRGKVNMQIASARAVIDFIEGRRPQHPVNPEVLDLRGAP